MHAVSPLTFNEFISHYTGRKKRAYYAAALDIKQLGYDEKWSQISMFIKADKYPEGEILAKAPRAIQFRNPRFNLLVGVWLKPLEEQFYELEHEGMRCISKNMTPDQKASALLDMWDNIDDPIALLADHSKFDSHVLIAHLKQCHKFYGRFCASKHLRWLLSQTLVNRGMTSTGLRYKIRGTRMSGDYDTALGNSLVNYIVLKSWLKKAGIKAYFLLDGDDSVIVCSRKDLAKLDFGHFAKMGFKTLIEQADLPHLIEYCRSKVLVDARHMARNWRRALSNYQSTIHYYPFRAMPRYLKGIALGDLVLSRGVPILQYWAQGLANLPGSPIYDPDSEWKRKITGETKPVYVTMRDRVDYHDQWHVSPEEQLAFEALDVRAQLKASASESCMELSTLCDA
nr:MAG: putative replicase [Planococcus ficus-associated tombus-like virus 1]